MNEEDELNIYFIADSYEVEGIKSCSLDYCVNYLKDKEVVSLDIETTRKFGGIYPKEGLDPYVTNIVMLQIRDENTQFVIDYREVDISPLLDILTSPDIIVVGQNIKFEYVHILHNEGIRLCNVYDTMISEQILYNGFNIDASLKALNLRYLNVEVDKDTRLELLSIKDKPFNLRQIKYGAEDILYPLKIRKKQLISLAKKDLLQCLKLEMLFLLCLGDIEYKGMHFDTSIWLNTYNENKIVYDNLKIELDEYIFKYFPKSQFVEKQLDLFSTDKKCTIQWSSSKQVIEFFKFLDVCPREVSKTTNKLAYTVNGKVLAASLKTFNSNTNDLNKEIIGIYLKLKETEQACTTFGEKFFKHINPITNRLHSNYRQILNTGRISSSGPNLQNIPAVHGFRSAFSCPDGYKIVNADYAGQEQIILANKSADKDLLYFYIEGLGDMHSYIASKIFPELANVSLADIKKYHKDKRQIAKAAGFAINYGGTGFTIAKNLGISDEEGNFVYTSYFKAFPGLKNYFKKVQKETLRKGYILIDPLTRRKNFFAKPNNNKERGSVERAALNFPIQGEAGSITKLAAIYYRKWILDNNMTKLVGVTNLVHDEINVEVKEEYAETAAKALEEAMEEAGKRWCKIVPLKADAVVTTFWEH